MPNKNVLTENLAAQNRLVDAEKIAVETLSDAQQKLDEQNSLILQAKGHLDKLNEGK